MKRLQDRVTLITGGAAGIGKATAERFAEEGATVVICDVNREAGETVAATLGPNAAFYEVNIADRQAAQDWIDAVVERYGRIDVLVNNAGVLRDGVLVGSRTVNWSSRCRKRISTWLFPSI